MTRWRRLAKRWTVKVQNVCKSKAVTLPKPVWEMLNKPTKITFELTEEKRIIVRPARETE